MHASIHSKKNLIIHMKQLIPLILLTGFLFSSCSSEKQKLAKAIANKEQELAADSLKPADINKAKEMIALYKQYAEKFKDDTLSNEYIFKAADISNGIGQSREAIALYAQVSGKQNFRKQAVALFLQGFIYENQLQDYFQARRIYQEFLDRYPGHPLTNDVTYSLNNLGKSPEELIKEFENKQLAGDSMAVK